MEADLNPRPQGLGTLQSPGGRVRLCHFRGGMQGAQCPDIERRPGNALQRGDWNAAAAMPVQATRRPGRDARRLHADYLRSGGSVLAYGLCEAASCPK